MKNELTYALNNRTNIDEAREKLNAFYKYQLKLQQEPSITQTYMGQEYVYTISGFERMYAGFDTVLKTNATLHTPLLVQDVTTFFELLKATSVCCNQVKQDWISAGLECSENFFMSCNEKIKEWQADLDAKLVLEREEAEKKMVLEQRKAAERLEVEPKCRDLSARLWTTAIDVCPFTVTLENIDHAKEVLLYKDWIMEGQPFKFNEEKLWLEVMKVADYATYEHAFFSSHSRTPPLPNLKNWHVPVTIFGKTVRCFDVWFEREDEERCVINTGQMNIARELMNEKEYIEEGRFDDDYQTIMAWIHATKLRLGINTLYYDTDKREICYTDERVNKDLPAKIFGRTVALPSCVNGGKKVDEEYHYDVYAYKYGRW